MTIGRCIKGAQTGRVGAFTQKNMIWLRHLARPMIAYERMAIMGWPVTDMKIAGLKEPELARLSGDMMSAYTLAAFYVAQLMCCPLPTP